MAEGAIAPRHHTVHRNRPSLDQTPSTLPYADDDVLTRSKSRYRRKPQSISPEPLPSNPSQRASDQHQQNAAPSRYHSKHRESPLNTLYKQQVVESSAPPSRTSFNATRRVPPVTSSPPEPRSPPNEVFVSERPPGSASQHVHRPRTAAYSPPQITPPSSQPTGELFPPPRPVDPPAKLDGPPQSSNIRATKSTSELSKYTADSEVGCFSGLFKRQKSEATVEGQIPVSARKVTRTEAPAVKRAATAGRDAPISAINAGDRHVLIECGKSKTIFPVTPTTTPSDLVKTAATCMSERIDVKSAVLLEYFGTVGVQRPLRRYEHVRDVMNSWDNDKQNSLVLVEPGAGIVERQLTVAGAPHTEPEEQSWLLSYSQKVGKWDKRVITLRASGQIVSQKDSDKPGDAVNVCHLSDFDIYTPTTEKIKKKIKPPKKICYAIKSQQKTSLFESTENFVHFFSIGDRETADRFYSAVHGWRSWYLVNVLGEGKKEPAKDLKTKVIPTVTELRGRQVEDDQPKTHRPTESLDSHYQLGSFRPLMDADQFDQQTSRRSENDGLGSFNGFVDSANQVDVGNAPERRATRRQHPPVSMNKKPQLADDEPLANLNRQSSVSKRRSSTEQRRSETAEFRDAGLLGRSYSQRRKEQAAREAQKQEPFTAGPNLLNRAYTQSADELANPGDGIRRQPSTRKQTSSAGDLKRSSSTRGGHQRGNSIDLDRSASRRQKPKPLVDLTPQFKEPPQHVKKGRGFYPDQTKAGGLISDATTPEDPLGIPVSTIFRNSSGTRGGPDSPGFSEVMPQHLESNHQSRRGHAYKNETEELSGGLLADDSYGTSSNTVSRTQSRRRAGSIGRTAQSAQRQTSGTRAQGPFTGEGLLASNKEGWGTGTKGRGVIDGSRAGGKPLVNLSEASCYAGGSLLAKVERANPIPAPVIDREKREERYVRSGERF